MLHVLQVSVTGLTRLTGVTRLTSLFLQAVVLYNALHQLDDNGLHQLGCINLTMGCINLMTRYPPIKLIARCPCPPGVFPIWQVP